MRERDPGFLSGIGASDVLRIGFAFLFSLAGLYLIWRMLFGPPLFGPGFQSQIRLLQSGSQNPDAPPRQRDGGDSGEISVGIAPPSPNPATNIGRQGPRP
ncbi:MAG: hypothetical protein ACREFW_09120 [Rhizomicrobium sp.]